MPMGPGMSHASSSQGPPLMPPGNWQGGQAWRPNSEMYEMDGEGLSRMARGSAGVESLVQRLEIDPHGVVEEVEDMAQKYCGVYFQNQPWSMERLAENRVKEMEGHRTLKKCVILLAHLYEMQRHREAEPIYARAFTAQALKCALDAMNSKGAWLTWPLLGLNDPDRTELSLTTANERVALAALAKEKVIVEKAVETALKNNKDG